MNLFKLHLFSVLALLGAMGGLMTRAESLHASGGETAKDQQAVAATALVGRVLGARASDFTVAIIPPAEKDRNVFEVESVQGKIVLRGDNAVSVASALNHYLKKYANCELSWCGDQLHLPAKLPAVLVRERIVCPHRYRVMFNYCTMNYSCSWWDWPRWERELDFMAMNGINMPLGVVGVEGVWYNTLVKSGFTDEEARAFLVGPAFSAWQWMGNIEGHGGPLPKSWIDARVALGQKWADRARELGMTPIRQGFCGYVPRMLMQKHPEASIVLKRPWVDFTGAAQLDPTDPLFKPLGKTFMEESVKLFGEGHYWAADPFHESEPPKPGAEYLHAVGKAIDGLMKEFDPQAIWVMQSWSIRKDIACAVPKEDLLVLDLGGARDDFWGYDFIKGQLHNYGGRINLHGDIRDITANRFAAAAGNNPHCVGMGLFPEGIIQNPVFYDCVFDMIWRDRPVDAETWATDYATRRYGAKSASAQAAWKILLNDGPYGPGTSATENSSMIAARPALITKKSGPNSGFYIPYPPMSLVKADELLLSCSDTLGTSDSYRYDLVDITRQVLSNYAQELEKEICLAYLKRDRLTFKTKTAQFHQLLLDVDTLLASRQEFLFGKWLADARSWGTAPEEKDYIAWNAAMLVTIWGPADEKNGQRLDIFDYSWREWSGLISRYYLPRWDKFHAMLEASIDKGDYLDPSSRVYGRESFRANDFYSKLADWEINFTRNSPRDLPATAQGDAIMLARQALEKYRARLAVTYAPERQKEFAADLLKNLPPAPDGTVCIGQWNSGDIATGGQEIILDVSKCIKDEGDYELAFNGNGGAHQLAVDWVALTVNGNEIMRDTHPGVTGLASKDNRYRLSPGPMVINGKYEVKARIRTLGGSDSIGVVTLRKKTD